MNKMDVFDVIIVGAGPSGSILAGELAKNGVKVLVIDKKKFPRNKACARGLTRRAMNAVPYDFSHLVEDYTYTAKMLIDNKLIYDKTFEEPLIGMVMRENLDQFLIEKAISNGAVFQDHVSFKDLSGTPGNLIVKTSKGSIGCRIIVGADGVSSKVARVLGFPLKRSFMTAVEGEVYLKSTRALEKLKGTVHYDFGVIPEGYGWIFPKKDHLSMGVVSISQSIRGWKGIFESYLKLKNTYFQSEIIDYRGHLIPFRSDKKNVFADQRGLIVGDATGYTDPLTGEGIFYAVKSGQLAADPILNAIENGGKALLAYNNIIKNEFHSDLTYANVLSLILYKLPLISHKLLSSQSERFGKNQIKVITGEQTYEMLFKKIFRLKKFIQVMTGR